MNYKRRYKLALERAKKLYEQGTITESLGFVFPELKESEDERIRKWCISHFNACINVIKDNDEYKEYLSNKVIAWLEKQGEQTHAKLGQSEVTKTSDQELSDIIEPKFKVGDWITDGQLICKVLSVTGKSYELHLHNDDYCHFETDVQSVDKRYHLWTIADAKDGDVLATAAGAFIYNGNNGGGGCPGSYCGINTLGKFQTGFEHHWTSKKVYPATKEQRDLLFQKMKEAGYEWDANKKELKKIGPKKLDVWNAEDEQNLNVVLSFIPDECLRRWLKDKLCYDTLDANKVIEWLKPLHHGHIVDGIINKLKKDLGL